MSNVVNITMENVPAGLDSMYARVEEDAITEGVRNVLYSGVTPVSGNSIQIDIGTAGNVGDGVIFSADNYTSGGAAFKAISGYGLIEAGELLKTYDTVVGVGDSIAQGEYDLAGSQYDTPFRGVNFRTGAVYGTTIQQMIDNITDFTSQAEGNTLFIVRAGINDCNTYLSAGGVGDGASGAVLAWDDMNQTQKDSTITAYRELISLLEQVGDVALGTITYCDAKGQLLPLPDKGRDLHSGSWNDNTTVPLCQELTPDWFDTATGRPIFDYYKVSYDSPEILDDDNLHFYNDRTYLAPAELGYTDGPGSYTIRKHTIDGVGNFTQMSSTPFDNGLFSNRILINVGRGNGLIGRPSYQRWANNLELSGANEVYPNLSSYNGTTNVQLAANFSSNGGAVANISTTGQVWSEGAGDTNNCSSGLYTGSSTLTHEISGLSKGVVSLVGIFSSSGAGGTYDPTARTVFEIEDDNGLRTVEAPSSIDGDVVTIADCTAYISFDCAVGGLLKITPRKATGSQYGSISSICIDIE